MSDTAGDVAGPSGGEGARGSLIVGSCWTILCCWMERH